MTKLMVTGTITWTREIYVGQAITPHSTAEHLNVADAYMGPVRMGFINPSLNILRAMHNNDPLEHIERYLLPETDLSSALDPIGLFKLNCKRYGSRKDTDDEHQNNVESSRMPGVALLDPEEPDSDSENEDASRRFSSSLHNHTDNISNGGKTIELKPGGKDIIVTRDNILEFLYLFVEKHLLGPSLPVMESIRTGVFDVIPHNAVINFGLITHKFETVKKHKCSVSQICMDRSGSYLISCANDSTVSIMGIGCNEYNYTVLLRQPARSIAIIEDFTKKGNQKFVTGEKRLEKGFFGIYNDKVIYDGKDPDGYIQAVSWKGDAIAFTNETGTRIYDCKLGRFLVLIRPLHNSEKYFSSRFPPLHSCFDHDTIAFGWGTNVVVAVLHRLKLNNFHVAGVSFTIQPQSTPEKKERKWKEIVIFGIKLRENKRKSGDNFDDTASAIYGISTYSMAVMALQIKQNQQVSIDLLLALPTDVDNYIIAAEDEISMKQSEQMFLRQFHLRAMAKDGVYYLLGPRELIEARPCSVEDRISWFLENEFYVEATNCTLAQELHETSVRNFDSAASYLPVICGRHKDEWEYYVGEFDKHGHVLKLVLFLPQLEPECYEMSFIVQLVGINADLAIRLILDHEGEFVDSELVILLGRSGNKVAALETIVEPINRVDFAIEFCAEHMDEDLWSRLIELAMNKPEHVTAILTIAGTYVDPLVVTGKIPPTMHVPKLQQSLHKVLRDSKLQVGLIEDCQQVRHNDVFDLFEKFIKQPVIDVDLFGECCICKKKVNKVVAELMIFGCGHFLH
uniref:HECT domain-containing protein n=1 Tax=Panagrolaimus davidi TaxID=227884 RepID=A0A914QGA6_9BILA